MLTLCLVAIAIVALLAHLVGRAEGYAPGVAARALESRAMVGVVFALTLLVIRQSEGSWHPIPVVQDEMAYVLQARILAQGRWSVPSPPIPYFWEQPQVLVQPVVAAKYFPGHPLLLAVGALAGWISIVPWLLQALAGSLLFVLARRVASGVVALLAWVLWVGAPMELFYASSYFSQATTVVCWLAGWYALLEWRTTRRRRWLLAVAVAVGWCAITRPLTGVAYAIPIGVVVLRDVVRQRRWADLGAALALGLAVLAIIPLWSARTTGSWRVTPLGLYTRQYRPYDVPGFGLDTTPPALAISPELERLNSQDYAHHRAHRPSALPKALVTRWRPLSMMIWGGSGGALFVFALLGLATLTAPSAFALAGSVMLLLTYLAFAAPPPWTLYYYESVPAYAFVTAAGLAWACAQIGRPVRRAWTAAYDWRSPRWTAPLVTGALLFFVVGLAQAQFFAASHRTGRRRHDHFAVTLSQVPPGRGVVFVRYAPFHDANMTYVRNSADLAAERLWVVRDLGAAENARLLALAPGRTPYLYDEASGRIQPYPTAAGALP